MAQLAFEQAKVHFDSHGMSDDCEGGDITTPPNCQTPLNKCSVEPFDIVTQGQKRPAQWQAAPD